MTCGAVEPRRRQILRRITRLTDALSEKAGNHALAASLRFSADGSCNPHTTLTNGHNG